MTVPSLSSRAKIVFLSLFSLLICIFGAAATRNMDISYAMGLENSAIPTRASFYSIVELPKPTYTPTPVIEIPTQTPTGIVEPANTAASPVAQVDVVADTPMPDYSASSNDQTHSANPNYSGNKSILIDISEQHMYAYEGSNQVFSFVSSTGMNNATRVGSFSVLDKIPNAYGATWDLWMPNWLGIYWAGSLENGIHALPILSNGTQLWAGYLGTPISFGCIVLGVDESQLLYDWADVGTPVDVQW